MPIIPERIVYRLMFECRRCKKRFYELSKPVADGIAAENLIKDWGLLTTVHRCEFDRVAIADFISADTVPVSLQPKA